MRLLNTRSLELVESFPDGVPKYAILSHRWEAGEVSYEEIHTRAARKKPGYAKIRNFCDEARAHGYEYAWIDTCCINKKDFTELAEAINSMFSWYRNSHICFAYLSDFTAEAGLSQAEFTTKLGRSRWFERGWTLQELIAPAHVEFYDADWQYFGGKKGLSRPISEITGIDEDLLACRRELRSYSVAQKMSWGAYRRTSRPEDKSYSLLGLFGVTMPLIYDGDRFRAFRRLQEEIIKHSRDQSLFAWVEHGPPPFDPMDIPLVDQECCVLAPTPECFRFSNNIMPYRHHIDDEPYSLNNVGLDTFQSARKVIKGGGTIVLEVFLDCYNYIGMRKHQVSILVKGSSGFLKSIAAKPTESRPRDYSKLPVTRIAPYYLGPAELPDDRLGYDYDIAMQISPVFLDQDDYRKESFSFLEKNRVQAEKATVKAMQNARLQVKHLRDERRQVEDRMAKVKGFLGLGGF
jgi:hypothetical protein